MTHLKQNDTFLNKFTLPVRLRRSQITALMMPLSSECIQQNLCRKARTWSSLRLLRGHSTARTKKLARFCCARASLWRWRHFQNPSGTQEPIDSKNMTVGDVEAVRNTSESISVQLGPRQHRLVWNLFWHDCDKNKQVLQKSIFYQIFKSFFFLHKGWLKQTRTLTKKKNSRTFSFRFRYHEPDRFIFPRTDSNFWKIRFCHIFLQSRDSIESDKSVFTTEREKFEKCLLRCHHHHLQSGSEVCSLHSLRSEFKRPRLEPWLELVWGEKRLWPPTAAAKSFKRFRIWGKTLIFEIELEQPIHPREGPK